MNGGAPALKGLAAIAWALATAAAVAVGAVLAIFFAATVVLIGVMASILLGLAGLALRAKRTARSRARTNETGLIEARHLGGHSWVAYGWNDRGQ